MRIPIGVSARHIHLTESIFTKLFGTNNVSFKCDLNQPGEFASNDTLTIKTEKDSIANVRVLGPLRSYNQVEISASDAYKLGLNPPVRRSGELENASDITLVGPNGTVVLPNSVIIAERHIHMTKDLASEYGYKDGDVVDVKLGTIKKGIIEAHIKVSDEAYTELHIDVDDANAFLLKNEDWVDIIR